MHLAVDFTLLLQKNLPAQPLMTRTLLITFMMECLQQDSLRRMILLHFSCLRHVETADTCSRQGQEKTKVAMVSAVSMVLP